MAKIPQNAAQRVSLVIKYLESKEVRSCESFMTDISAIAATESILDRLPPIAALVERTLDAFGNKLSRDPKEQHAILYPYRTARGDA